MNIPISHRWTLYVARKSKGRCWPYIWIAFSLAWVGFYFWSGLGLWLVFSIVWAIIALIYVERRAFYEILQAKESEIDQLRRTNPGP